MSPFSNVLELPSARPRVASPIAIRPIASLRCRAAPSASRRQSRASGRYQTSSFGFSRAPTGAEASRGGIGEGIDDAVDDLLDHHLVVALPHDADHRLGA